MNVLEGSLEGIVGVSVFGVQGPCQLFVKSLQILVLLLGDSRHDRVDSLRLVVTLFALHNIGSRNTTLREINVS